MTRDQMRECSDLLEELHVTHACITAFMEGQANVEYGITVPVEQYVNLGEVATALRAGGWDLLWMNGAFHVQRSPRLDPEVEHVPADQVCTCPSSPTGFNLSCPVHGAPGTESAASWQPGGWQ